MMTGNDSWVCEGWGLYPKHDWVVLDERDGERSLLCRRCDADAVEPIEGTGRMAEPTATGEDTQR